MAGEAVAGRVREPQCPFLDYVAAGFWFLRDSGGVMGIILPFSGGVKRAVKHASLIAGMPRRLRQLPRRGRSASIGRTESESG